MFLNPSAPLKTLLYCSESFKTSPSHSRISFTFQNNHKPFRLYHDLSGPFYSFQHDSAHLKSFLEQSKTFQELVRLFQTNKDLSELWKLLMNFDSLSGPFETFQDPSGISNQFKTFQDHSGTFKSLEDLSGANLPECFIPSITFSELLLSFRTFKTIQELSSHFKTCKELNKLPECFIPFIIFTEHSLSIK